MFSRVPPTVRGPGRWPSPTLDGTQLTGAPRREAARGDGRAPRHGPVRVASSTVTFPIKYWRLEQHAVARKEALAPDDDCLPRILRALFLF
jgi:hypothetical protein